jgi:hypothetical protein
MRTESAAAVEVARSITGPLSQAITNEPLTRAWLRLPSGRQSDPGRNGTGAGHRGGSVSKKDHVRDVPDRHPGHRICQVVASQKFVSEEAVAILRHCPHATSVRKECTEANLEPVSDTATTCPVRFPLQPSCCLPACTDPYIRLASACLGTRLTVPFRYRGRRRERIPEQPYGSRIRHEDRKSAFAISTRILQRPQVETSSSAKNIRNLH